VRLFAAFDFSREIEFTGFLQTGDKRRARLYAAVEARRYAALQPFTEELC